MTSSWPDSMISSQSSLLSMYLEHLGFPVFLKYFLHICSRTSSAPSHPPPTLAALRPFLIFYFCSAAGQNKKHLKITKTAVIFKESNKMHSTQFPPLVLREPRLLLLHGPEPLPVLLQHRGHVPAPGRGSGSREWELGPGPTRRLALFFYRSPQLRASCFSPETCSESSGLPKTKKAALILTIAGAPRGRRQNRNAPGQSQTQKEKPKLARE